MDEERTRIEKQILEAFRGVLLGEGIGLREGCGLDDHAGPSTLAAYRAQDERDHWESIPDKTLADYSDSLCFFDGRGMRFHLPAYLISELRGGNFSQPILFHLTHINADDHRLSLLNDEQRQAVREFFIYILSTLQEPALSFERPLIEYALTEVWHIR